MALDTEKYTWTDGKTPISAAELNTRFWAIVRRLHALETLSINWAAAVAEVQNHGLARINEAVLPLVDDLRGELSALIAQGGADLASQVEKLDALLARGDASLQEWAEGMDGLLARIEARLVDVCPLDDAGLVPLERIPVGATWHPGMILMWSGATNAVPTGWALCDGENGTPDLRDRFVLGAGGSRAPGDTGGDEEHTHIVTVQPHTLTISEMPTHNHTCEKYNILQDKNATWSSNPTLWMSTQGASTGDKGGSEAHNHGAIASDESIMPPFYALCYIIKIED